LSVRSEESPAPAKLTRLNRNSKLLKVIINAIQDKKGEHVISLDLRKIPEAVADFFIVCEASSTVQVRAIADWVEVQVKKECGEPPYKHEGHTAAQWILVDYVNVVVHVFHSETRKFYKLEEMWGDGDAEEQQVTDTVIKPRKSLKSKI
jgi:ribosome-associated protein